MYEQGTICLFKNLFLDVLDKIRIPMIRKGAKRCSAWPLKPLTPLGMKGGVFHGLAIQQHNMTPNYKMPFIGGIL